MTQLSIDAKKVIIRKALSRGDTPLEQIASENNVGYSTLQKWLRRQRDGLPLPGEQQTNNHNRPSGVPPLQHLLATAKLDEEAVGTYCREHGIHSFQLKQWKNDLMTHDKNHKQKDNSRNELKALRDENKKLKKELRRKDKALAETSALLVLKKKADLIWGEDEED